MNTQCIFKIIHHLVQIIRADIFRKNFQIFEFMICGWFGCGNTKYDKKTNQYDYD